MKVTNDIVFQRLDSFANKILSLNRKRFFEFKGVKFYPSEIHLILLVMDRNATNATKIAEKLGITKGAVSQTLTRLEKKGVLTKTKDPFHKNELTLHFTSYGDAVCNHYKRHTAKIQQQHRRIIDRYTNKEKDAIQRFLGEVESVFDELE